MMRPKAVCGSGAGWVDGRRDWESYKGVGRF